MRPSLRTLVASFRTPALAAAALVLLASGAASAQSVSTFTLDGLSYVSFGTNELIALPPGSTIKFRFETPAPDGSVAFTIRPEDIGIAPIDLAGGAGRLEYAIGQVASGTLSPTPTGRRIAFQAVVRATLTRASGQGSFNYAMPFTTDDVAATSLDGSQTLSTYGMRVIDGVWYAQIVGATTNKENAFPEPGAAVTTILSGQFDTIP